MMYQIKWKWMLICFVCIWYWWSFVNLMVDLLSEKCYESTSQHSIFNLISEHSGICLYIRYYKVQGYTQYIRLMHASLRIVAQYCGHMLLRINFPIFNFWSYLIGLSYLISDHSSVWHYIHYYKVQGHTRYTHLMHGQHMHHCTLRRSTADTCI